MRNIANAAEVALLPSMRAELHRVSGPFSRFKVQIVVGYDPVGPRGGTSGRWVEGNPVYDAVLSVAVVRESNEIFRDLLARIAHLDEQDELTKLWAAERAMEADSKPLERSAG